MCSLTSNYSLTSDLSNVMYKLTMVEKPLQKVLASSSYTPPQKNIIPLWPSYYITHIPQNTIRKTALKHYNEFRHVRTEALRWGTNEHRYRCKFKVETSAKE